MKTVAVVFLVVIGCQFIYADLSSNFQNDDTVNRAIGDRLKSLLEDFKRILQNGDTKLGIPPHEPLEIKHRVFNIDNDKLFAKAEINDFRIDGISNYNVQNVDLKFGTWVFTLDVLWPTLDTNTLYQLESLLFSKIPLYGAGGLSLKVDGLNLATQIKLKVDYKNKKVSVVEMNNTKVLVDKLKFHVTGLFNDEEISEFVSAVVTDIAAQGLKDYQEQITAIVNKGLMKRINGLLDLVSLDDILALIQTKN